MNQYKQNCHPDKAEQVLKKERLLQLIIQLIVPIRRIGLVEGKGKWKWERQPPPLKLTETYNTRIKLLFEHLLAPSIQEPNKTPTQAALTISSTEQPLERSINGLLRPCKTGPVAVAPPIRSVIL